MDDAGRVYTPGLMDRTAGVTEWKSALIRVGPDDATRDTLPVPEPEHERKILVARRTTGGGTSTSATTVPFTASAHWAYSPLGYFVVGVSDRYALSLLRAGEPVLRIEKAWTPVPVKPGEKAEAERRVTESMRSTDPNWRWDGPGIPDTKPAFRSLFVAGDGRIWVLTHQPAFEIDVEEETGEPRPGSLKTPRPRALRAVRLASARSSMFPLLKPSVSSSGNPASPVPRRMELALASPRRIDHNAEEGIAWRRTSRASESRFWRRTASSRSS
ncbi:MAG TPA: hypothetical protein VIL18_11000 [Longimicrobiales bacterium]